jgi:ubiquinone/menaquinone biosynthesis C-methylase UbiE
LDEVKAKEFVSRIAGFYNGTAITLMIDVGFRTGLWDAAAAGPASSHDLAQRAGLQERYVREWLGAVTSAGIVEYDAASIIYTLPPEHAHSLAGNGGSNRAANAPLLTYLGKHVSSVVSAFKNGGGVPYSQFRPEFTGFMDERFRREYDQFLLDGYIRKVPGLEARLESGVSMCDIGCGTGHNINLLAKAFPQSDFTGYDIAADAIDLARAEAAKMGLENAHFEVQDATDLPKNLAFDLITTFDAVHDQANPQAALHEISRCLAPGGTYLMIDIKASSKLENNLDNPMSPYLYAVSTMHCMTVSLAENGAGLGTCWGQELALEMLEKAGLTDVDIFDSTNPTNCIYVCRKP